MAFKLARTAHRYPTHEIFWLYRQYLVIVFPVSDLVKCEEYFGIGKDPSIKRLPGQVAQMADQVKSE
jgi:hypothetical protein